MKWSRGTLPRGGRTNQGPLRARLGLLLGLSLAMTGGVDHKAAQLNNQANEEYEAAKLDEAAKLYDEAQTRAPDSPAIAYNRGNALYRQGKLEDAVRQLMQGAQSTEPDLQRRSYYNLGNALHDLKKLPEAAAAYRHALSIDPLDRNAKINYEKTLEELRQQQQQQQGSQSKSDKDKQQQQQKGQQGQQQQNGQQSDDQQAQNGEQQQRQQSGDQNSEKSGEQQQPQSGDQPQEQGSEDETRQAATIDSVAAGDLSREEAVRILEAMREQERELQKERARKPMRSRRVEKDW